MGAKIELGKGVAAAQRLLQKPPPPSIRALLRVR